MVKTRKTYSGQFGPILLAGGAGGNTDFRLINNGRNNLLKSVIWQAILVNDLTGDIMPVDNNTDVDISINIFQLTTSENVAFPFDSVTPPAPASAQSIALYKPGQYFFNDMLFSNGIYFSLAYANLVAHAHQLTFAVTVEIEEKSYFNS